MQNCDCGILKELEDKGLKDVCDGQFRLIHHLKCRGRKSNNVVRVLNNSLIMMQIDQGRTSELVPETQPPPWRPLPFKNHSIIFDGTDL